MSHPGIPAGETFVRDRLAAGRGASANPIDPEILELAEGGGGAQTASLAPSPSGTGKPSSAGQDAPPVQPDLPLGQRLNQWMENYQRQEFAAQKKRIDDQPDTMGEAFVQPMSEAWGALKKNFTTWYQENGGKPHDLVSLDGLKQQWMDSVQAGKLPIDAFNVVISPAVGALSALTTGASKLVPFVPSKTVKTMLDDALVALGPATGPVGAASKARAAGEAGEAVTQAGKHRAATGNAELSGEGLPKAGAEPPPRAFDITGEVNPPGNALKVTPELRDQAERFLKGGRADNPIQASLETLAKDPDIGATIKDVARFIPKGKVKPDDIRDMNAYSLNLQPDEILERLKPAVPSDELQAAAGMLVNSAGSEFQKFAKVAMADPSPENWEAATRAYAYANQVIGKFRDAGTDLGRGLRARQATQDARDSFGQAIQQLVKDVGPENIDEAIRKAAALPDPRSVSPFVSSLRWMGGREGLLFGWYNWLLSNPRTIVSNVLSNTGTSAWNVAVRYAAEKFGSGDIRAGEAANLLQGYVGSMRDGIKAAGKALKAGESQFYGDYTTLEGRVISRTDNYPPAGLQDGDITSGATNWLRAALPTSWIGAADDFAKVTNYRAESRALAYRDGSIKGLTGPDLGAHVEQMMNNMPEHLHHQAISATMRNTFQEPLTGIAEKLQDVVDLVNIPTGTGVDIPLGRIIMPFVKTPANLVKFAYHNSALAYLIPSSRIKAELAAGGASRDLALARMGLGTAVSVIAAPFMAAGMITGRGPSDPQMNRAWREAGNRPYSVNLGGTWYGYNKVDPLGLHLGALADTIGTVRFARDEDADQLAWSMAFGMGDALLSKTYMQGMSNFLEALHDPQGEGKYYGDRLVAAMAMPSGANAAAIAGDDWMREHYDTLDAIQARTPGLASGLPPVRDIWGQPVANDKSFLPLAPSALAKMVSPIQMRPADDAQPVDKWIWENRAAFPDSDNGRLGLSRPGKVQSFDIGPSSVQVELTNHQLDRLRELAGNGLKDPATGLGARDYLNALVKGEHPQAATQRQWDGASPAAKAVMLLRVWNRFRSAAKQQLLSENADMQATVEEKANTRIEALRAPTIGE